MISLLSSLNFFACRISSGLADLNSALETQSNSGTPFIRPWNAEHGGACTAGSGFEPLSARPCERPEFLGDDGVLHFSDRWGRTHDESTQFERFTRKVRARLTRFVEPSISDEVDSVTRNLSRERRHLLTKVALAGADLGLISGAFVVETRLLVSNEG